MPTAFPNQVVNLTPHIEMWGYCVLSCLTAFLPLLIQKAFNF